MTPATLFWLVTGSLMLQPLSTDLYLATLPGMAADFGATPLAVQHTLSMFVIGFGTAQLLSGPMSDRFGRRPVLIGGLTIYLLASLACVASPTLAWLVMGRFAQAVGCCTAVVVARAIVRDEFPPAEGAHVLAKASSMLSLAPLLGPVLGGYLQVAFGWRAAFVALSFAGFVVWLSALFQMRETNAVLNPEAVRAGNLARNYAAVLKSPGFWAYALPGALSYASIFVFISGTPFVLIKVLGVATEHYGYLFALGVLGYLTGTLSCRRLLRTRGIHLTLRLGTAIGFVAGSGFLVLVAAGIHHWALVVGALFAVMTAHGINIPCTQAGSLAPFSENAGAAAGMFGFVMMAVALLAGIWVSGSHDGTLYPLAYISAVVSFLLFASARLLARFDQAR